MSEATQEGTEGEAVLPLTHAESALLAAEGQEHVAARRRLAQLGVPRWYVRNELARRRWQKTGRQTVVLHNGPLSTESRRWIAVLEVGSRAVLDGVTALQAAGIKGLSDTVVVVSTPKGSTPVRRLVGVRLRETRRYRVQDVITTGIPRMCPAAAAIHAALWALSDRQAKLLVVMTVQQRLATVAELKEVLDAVRRHRRRRLLHQLLVEVAAGSQSLGELDLAAGLRRRGLPEPTRQSIRKRPSGTEYLDCEFPEYDLVAEVDGAGHDEAAQQLSDVLRDLQLVAERKNVIRISLVAWALDQEAVLDGLEAVFASRGWLRPAA